MRRIPPPPPPPRTGSAGRAGLRTLRRHVPVKLATLPICLSLPGVILACVAPRLKVPASRQQTTLHLFLRPPPSLWLHRPAGFMRRTIHMFCCYKGVVYDMRWVGVRGVGGRAGGRGAGKEGGLTVKAAYARPATAWDSLCAALQAPSLR